MQLVQATRVKFTMSDDTTLSDLLSLNLHNFEDEVHGIVDKACKEMGMEKLLNDLETNWKDMKFDYEEHPSGAQLKWATKGWALLLSVMPILYQQSLHNTSGYKLMRTSEELIETLEENQVVIQNMMTSKYIAFFLEEISSWQKRLSMVDQVISLWFDVQRTWSHLESIFIGSEDIRWAASAGFFFYPRKYILSVVKFAKVF